MKIATGRNDRIQNHGTAVREYATIEVTAKKMVQYYYRHDYRKDKRMTKRMDKRVNKRMENKMNKRMDIAMKNFEKALHRGRFVGLSVKLTVPETTPIDTAAADDTKQIKAVIAAAESKKTHKQMYEFYENTDPSQKRKLELDEKERAEKLETRKAEARKMRGVVHRSLCCSFLDALNYLYCNGFVTHECIAPKFFQFSRERIVEDHDEKEQHDETNASWMLLENQTSEKNDSDSLASQQEGVILEFAGVHFDQSYDSNRCWIIKEAETNTNAVLVLPSEDCDEEREYEPDELLSCKTNCEIFYEFEVSHCMEWMRQRGYERRTIHQELEDQFRSVLTQHTSLHLMLYSRVRQTGLA